MEGFSIKIDYYPQNNDIVIVKLLGYVDQSNSHQIEKVISDLIQSRKQKFVFDLSELIYMSSAGWGIFVGEVKSVREVGGDIKVASMSPEIYDVFQVLEFYHILDDYSTVEEAVSSFLQNGDEGIGLVFKDKMSVKEEDTKLSDSKSDTETFLQQPAAEEQAPVSPRPKEKISRPTGPSSRPISSEVTIDLARLPLTEKIKKIASVYPLLNIRQIKRMLKHEKFGSVKISTIKLYRMLRLLNLHTKKNRYRYYRSV
jgi:anti-sigma B factor antagonist